MGLFPRKIKSYSCRAGLMFVQFVLGLTETIVAALWDHGTGIIVGCATIASLCFVINRQSTRGHWQHFRWPCLKHCYDEEETREIEFDTITQDEAEQERPVNKTTGPAKIMYAFTLLMLSWSSFLVVLHIAGPDPVDSTISENCPIEWCAAGWSTDYEPEQKNTRRVQHDGYFLGTVSPDALATAVDQWVDSQSLAAMLKKYQYTEGMLQGLSGPSFVVHSGGFYHARVVTYVMGWPDDVYIQVLHGCELVSELVPNNTTDPTPAAKPTALTSLCQARNNPALAKRGGWSPVTRVYAQSKSRLPWGSNDLGVNSARVRTFFSFLNYLAS